jgi:hypothetical protein
VTAEQLEIVDIILDDEHGEPGQTHVRALVVLGRAGKICTKLSQSLHKGSSIWPRPAIELTICARNASDRSGSLFVSCLLAAAALSRSCRLSLLA